MIGSTMVGWFMELIDEPLFEGEKYTNHELVKYHKHFLEICPESYNIEETIEWETIPDGLIVYRTKNKLVIYDTHYNDIYTVRNRIKNRGLDRVPYIVWRKEFNLRVMRRLNFLRMRKEELANLCGLTDDELHKVLNGYEVPSGHLIMEMSKVMACSPLTLMDFDYLI